MLTVIQNKIVNHIKFYRNIRITGISASAIMAAIMTLAAFPIITHLNIAEAAPGTAVASDTVLTFTSTLPSANLNLVVNDTNGTFASSSESELAKFGIITNNYTGYTLSIKGVDDTKQLSTSTGKTLDSISYAMDAGVFGGDTATAFNGKWGYLPSKYNSLNNTEYLPSPTTTASTLDETKTANSESNEYTIALGARADYSVPNGVYSNTFILALVANPIEYTINYADNSGDDAVASTLPAPTTGETSNTFIPITTNKPTRTNYTFLGWCNKPTTLNSEGETVCPEDGVTYNSGENYEIDQTTSNITTLYTIWTINKYNLTINFSGSGVVNVKVCRTTGDCTGEDLIATITASGNKVENLVSGHTVYLYPSFNDNYEFSSWENSGSYGTLSCTASNTCSSDQNPSFTVGGGDGIVTITGKIIAIPMQNLAESECTTTARSVYDTRDNQIYLIQQLADGRCWMLDNLRLGATDIDVDLTRDNTNISTVVTASAWNSYHMTTGLFGSWAEPKFNSDSSEITNDDSSKNWGDGSHKYGVYYNYCAATAGTYCVGQGSSSGNAKYDICPSGWRMPTGGGGSGEFYSLYLAYSRNYTNFKSALSIPLSGYYYWGSVAKQGDSGRFWSPTFSGNTNYMYSLSADNSSLSFTFQGERDYGYSVRCVLKKNPLDVVYMQNMTAFAASTAKDGDTFTLTDERDSQTYTVSKINGNVWMTRNLAIGCAGSGSTYSADRNTVKLTSSDSNVAENYSTSDASTGTGTNNGMSKGYMKCDATYGATYNYKAATANTISGDSNTSTDKYNVCPLGWTLPSREQMQSIGVGTTYVDAFNPNHTSSPGWWSSTSSSSNYRYYLRYIAAGAPVGLTVSVDSRSDHYYVRCVAKT